MFSTRRIALLAATAAIACSGVAAQAGHAAEPRPVVDGRGAAALIEEEGLFYEVVAQPEADGIIAVLIGLHAPRPFTPPIGTDKGSVVG
jgi:hypothetical protein